MSEPYQGACHCGRVTFELRTELQRVIDCNCSICHLRGAVWHGAAEQDLTITAGESDLTLYQFNTNTAKHYFCSRCGITPFIRPRLNPGVWAVNVRCLAGVDVAALPVQHFDGVNWEDAAKAYAG